MRDFKAWLLIAFAFFSSFAASGSLPLISKAMGEANGTWGFAPYFFFLLVGQCCVVFSKRVRESSWTLPLVLFGFAITVFILDILLRATVTDEVIHSISALRAFEGLLVGVGLPRVFEGIVKADFGRSSDFRLVILNLSNVVGFVAGVPASELWSISDISFLRFCGLILFLNGVLYLAVQMLDRANEAKEPSVGTVTATEALEHKFVDAHSSWFGSSFLLFTAKTFYGLLISSLIFQKGLIPFPMFGITVVIAIAFAVGQAAAAFALKSISAQRLEVMAPLAFAVSLGLFAWAGTFPFLAMCLFLHSTVYFYGIRKASLKTESSREFARINCLSEPGVVIGSVLPLLSSPLPVVVIAVLGLVPFLLSFYRTRFSPELN